MRLGVFGGTFNPVHMGHLAVAEEVRVRLGLEEVLFMPAGQPWLKSGLEVTGGYHRLEMVKLAVASNPHFRVSDLEIRRPGPSYSADTLEELDRSRKGQAELHLLVGLDALKEMARWQRPRRVLELATLVGIARPGFESLDRKALDAVRAGASEKVVLVTGPLVGISGTEIRERVSQGLSIKYLVPEPVESYIYEQGLYRGTRDHAALKGPDLSG